MKKKLAVCLLCGAMSAAMLTGCGGSGDSGSKEAGTDVTVTQTPLQNGSGRGTTRRASVTWDIGSCMSAGSSTVHFCPCSVLTAQTPPEKSGTSGSRERCFMMPSSLPSVCATA